MIALAPVSNLFYIAAHAGFPLERVPLGGGGTIAARLDEEWRRTRPFPYSLITPAVLGDQAPREKDLVRYSEIRYARFCRAFEKSATDAVLRKSSPESPVLCNDISEGPDFARLAAAGHSVWTIFHVDVLDYFCRIYLREKIRPEKAAAIWRALEKKKVAGWIPGFLDLIFQKQADAVRHSTGLIVMSGAMKDTLERCYPQEARGKIHVMPWGVPDPALDESRLSAARIRIAREFPIPARSRVIVSLSRITPEKGQDRLLQALARWETQRDFPVEGVTYFLVGEAAYMQGKRFEKRLRALASQLKRTQVYFTGYRAGEDKQAILEKAELYVFPSRHESYGLTLLEAMQAGLPVLSTSTYGATEMVTPERGGLISGDSDEEVVLGLTRSLPVLLENRTRLQQQAAAARMFAASQRFSETASRLADLLIHHRNR